MKEKINDIKNNIVDAFNSDNIIDKNKAAPVPELLKKNKRIAILTDNGVEDSEFLYPYYRFYETGYDVDVITLKGGEFEGKKGTLLKESKSIEEVHSRDYEALYLPGGKAPQKIRENQTALQFVLDIANAGKVIGAICHGPQILISADLVRGKKIASWPEIKNEVEEAGATFVDEALQIDGNLITARRPGDLHRHMYGVLKALEK